MENSVIDAYMTEIIMTGCPTAFIWPIMRPTEQLLGSVPFASVAFILLREGVIFDKTCIHFCNNI